MIILDRLEGSIAVLEIDGAEFNIPSTCLPAGVKEGDVLEITINTRKTEDRRKKINRLMDDLFE